MTVTARDPQQNDNGMNTNAIVDGEDVFRANIYGMLARMLTEPPSDDTMEILRGLNGAGDGTEIGDALANLGAVAVRTPVGRAAEEYTKLFYGHGAGGDIHPYASYYLTGFVYEKPLADLRADLMEIGIERSGHNSEPEDHIAFLCEVMHGLITGAFGRPGGAARQQSFFRKHIAPWAGMMFADLEAAESAALYMPLAALARLFLVLEAEAFEMAA
jgi:TorA maturation chaperone TorD